MTNEQLVLRIRSGEDVAENMVALYEQNRGIIAKLALKYQHYAEFDDLMQEGYIGLCHAVDSWKPDSAFITYAAILIKQEMWRYIYNNGSSIRVSIPTQENVWKYEKIRQQCLKHWGREPEDWEYCGFMRISQKQLDRIKVDSANMKIGSLDKCIGEDEDTSLVDLIPDQNDQYESILDAIKIEELKKVIWPIVDGLPEVQSSVIRKRFQDKMTLKEISADLGCSAERVRQFESKGLRAIRYSPNKSKLYPFMYDEELHHKGMQGTGLASFKRSWTSATEREALWTLEPG